MGPNVHNLQNDLRLEPYVCKLDPVGQICSQEAGHRAYSIVLVAAVSTAESLSRIAANTYNSKCPMHLGVCAAHTATKSPRVFSRDVAAPKITG